MTTDHCDLRTEHCKPCEGGVPPLDAPAVERLLGTLNGWTVVGNEIAKTYRFRNYYETIAFVNATAWISHQENHHPDLEVGFRECRVRYSTHAIGGLSENDFICAAKIDALLPTNGDG
jgi:4a-hydroxytetrahydrobiopterin dehydratase